MTGKESMKIRLLPVGLSIWRTGPSDPVPDPPGGASFHSVTRTEDEISIVCETGAVPAGVEAEGGWRALKVVGPLDFGLTGVLSGIIGPLGERGISVFVLSTYDTDYILVRDGQVREAVSVLGERFDIA